MVPRTGAAEGFAMLRLREFPVAGEEWPSDGSRRLHLLAYKGKVVLSPRLCFPRARATQRAGWIPNSHPTGTVAAPQPSLSRGKPTYRDCLPGLPLACDSGWGTLIVASVGRDSCRWVHWRSWQETGRRRASAKEWPPPGNGRGG